METPESTIPMGVSPVVTEPPESLLCGNVQREPSGDTQRNLPDDPLMLMEIASMSFIPEKGVSTEDEVFSHN